MWVRKAETVESTRQNDVARVANEDITDGDRVRQKKKFLFTSPGADSCTGEGEGDGMCTKVGALGDEWVVGKEKKWDA
jgi:hypothetical protein